MIAGCTRRFRRYSPIFSRDLVPVAFAIPFHRNIPMDKYLHLSCLLLISVDLVITRYPENILCLLPCSSLPPEYTYKLILTHTEDLFLPSCSCVPQRTSKYYLVFRKSSTACCSWNSCILAFRSIPFV